MIHFLVKVFSKKSHAEKFLSGELHAKRLSWFKKLEGDSVRGDEFEAAIVPQLDNLIFTMRSENEETGVIEESTIQKEEFASPPIIQPNCFDYVNLFCMYAAHGDDIMELSVDNIDQYKKQLELPEEYVKMGDHAVVIIKNQEFVNRVKTAARRKGHKIYERLVSYYDLEVGLPLSPWNMGIVFTKSQVYAYQKEFRFAIDTGTIGCNPISLDIGKINDIAILMNTADINRQLSLKIN